jgi:peptidoglycan/LPS O-acetylase OafA/YrhL
MTSAGTQGGLMQINQLTFTRFVAALTVVYYHYGTGIFPFNNVVLRDLFLVGNISVSYFYVLSGFIMAVVYNKKAVTKFDMKEYWLARFARVYPVYLLALLLTVLIMDKGFVNNRVGFGLSSLMLQAWIPHFPTIYNYPGWSISIEAFFYALFPFIMVSFSRSGTTRVALAVTVFWLSSNLLLAMFFNYLYVLPPSVEHDLLFYLPLMHLNTFLVGVVGGIIYVRHGNKLAQFQLYNFFIMTISILLTVLVLCHRHSIESRLPLTNGLLAPLFLVFIFTWSCDKTFISKFFSNKGFVLLGDASYSLYIMQLPIYIFFRGTINRNNLLGDVVGLHTYVILLILMSIIIHLFVEKPARNWLKELLKYYSNWKKRAKSQGQTLASE